MTDYHGNSGYKTPAPGQRGRMGEDRDRDHVVRQGHPGAPPSSPLFVSTCTARTSPHPTQSGLLTFPSPHLRRPSSSPGLQYPRSSSSSSSSVAASLLEQRSSQPFGEFVYPAGQPRLDRWPDAGDAVCRLQTHHSLDYPSGDVRYGAVPESQQRRPGLLLSPKSSVARSSAGVSLPLRSPKRTISFDFPYSMDPRRREKIHRHIVHMAQEAGASDGVKVVEEPPEEEEESLPVFQLQDPPKPKFKRQLSADSSPPDSHTAQTAVSPDSAAGRQHVQPGGRMTSSSLSARPPCTLSLLQTPSGSGGYPSSALSPKRLKSEHGTPLPCTPPKSPVVKQLATQVAETTLSKRGGGQAESRRNQVDVVHIFSRLGDENVNDRNNNNDNNNSAHGSKMKGGDCMSSSSDIGHGDEPDSRPKQKTENRTSGKDVVSVLNIQQSQKQVEKTKLPPVSTAQITRKPEDSMQTLEMLFKPKGDISESRKQQSPTKNTASSFDRQSVRPDTESDRPIHKQVTGSSSENGSQKADRTEPQMADKDCTPASKPQQLTESASIQPSPSIAIPDLRRMTSLTKSEDMEIDSDPYLAELAGRLEDMQRRILSQHPAFAGQLAALTESREGPVSEREGPVSEREGPVTGQRPAGNQDRQTTTETLKGTSTSSATAISSTSHGMSTEEESRTARLCRSKTNPFTFSSRDIEKAQTALSTCDPPRYTPPPPPPHSHQEGRREDVSGTESSGTKTQSAGPFRLGELWISRARQSQANLGTTLRQLSDPGTRHPPSTPTPPLKPVLEKVRPTPLRQFSEPARPQNQTDNPDPSEFQKNFKPADRTLQQTGLSSEDCREGLKLLEARPTFFLREDEKGASDTMCRNCPTTPPHNQSCRVGGAGSEPSRKRSEKSSPCERNFIRDPFWHAAYKQPHPGELHAATSPWITPPRSQMYRQDRVPASTAARQMLPEDDSVFVDVSTGQDGGGSPFKNPAFPSVVFADRFLERSADRCSGSVLSADTSPRRPALRSHSNVEQSPNKAELEAMVQYRYLRSFSEHISDPKRLMEQLRAMPPADYEQLMEQLQGMQSRATLSASFSSEKDSDLSSCSWSDRPRGVRRTLFQEMPDERPAVGGYELAEWPQQGCYTYPPPLARRQHCSSPGCRDLRRSLSWIRDMERSGPSDVTRSRQPGDLDVTLECTQATAAHHHQYYPDTARATSTTAAHHPEILRAKIETYLQQILKSQLHSRPSGTASQADMTRWIAQAREIERLTEEASQLISTLSEHHRTVYDVLTGSVVIKVNCTTLPGVLDLWEKFEAGVLQEVVDRLVGGEGFLALTGAAEVKVMVWLSPDQCVACLEELAAGRSPEALTPVHNFTSRESSDIGLDMEKKNTERKEATLQDSRFAASPPCDVTSFDAGHEWMTSPARLSPSLSSPSTPSKRHGKFVFGDCSARKAFSELNLSDGELTPTSPTGKKFFDTTLQKENSGLSPLVSPRVQPSTTARGRASLSDVMDANQELTGDKT